MTSSTQRTDLAPARRRGGWKPLSPSRERHSSWVYRTTSICRFSFLSPSAAFAVNAETVRSDVTQGLQSRRCQGVLTYPEAVAEESLSSCVTRRARSGPGVQPRGVTDGPKVAPQPLLFGPVAKPPQTLSIRP